MPDNLPGRSRDEGAGRSLSRAEFGQRERKRKALDLWIGGMSYAKIKNAMKLRSTDAARELVAQGEQLWQTEETTSQVRHVARMVERMYEIIELSREGEAVIDGDGIPVRDGRGEVVRVTNWSAVDREMKAWDRLSRLLGLDAVREAERSGGDTYLIAAGGDVNMVPKGAGTVIDVRRPDERPEWREAIEGEVAE